ncbi:CrcB protein [Euzebya pacifica]|uniref:Fluoride-specific ion channel FluC n=1 Tax=Euzebya pacifica TaxID=1608957 RepID=A0A346XT66_9ACTN|nr:CrcB family protein [Euzebya pacifica]AXV05413.1 CrcB protein [Euzebya pacifica]
MTTTIGAPSARRTAMVVAAGGAVGALLRWQLAGGLNDLVVGDCPGTVNCLPSQPAFPWGTLLVNVVGALLLGWLASRQVDPLRRAFLGTGVLGAFTTFSAFAVEAVLVGRRSPLEGIAYVVVTLAVGLGAARLGQRASASGPEDPA